MIASVNPQAAAQNYNIFNSNSGKISGNSNSAALKSAEVSILHQTLSVDTVSISDKNGTFYTSRSMSAVNEQIFYKIDQAGNQYLSYEKTSVKASIESIIARGNVAEAELEDVEDYWSPENTAGRIYNFATSFFGAFAEQHGLDPESREAREAFDDLIRPAVTEGYEQARAILGALPDEVSQKIETTMDLVYEKLDAFVEGTNPSYMQNVMEKASELVKNSDKNDDQLLTREETDLDKKSFEEIDADNDKRITIKELAEKIARRDITKDLDNAIVKSVLKPLPSDTELAKQAQALLAGSSILDQTFLLSNPKTASVIIDNSNPDSPFSFADYLTENPDKAADIKEDPSVLDSILEKFKVSAVSRELAEDSPITTEILQASPEKREFLYQNPVMIEFFSNNAQSAANFAIS